MSQRRPWLAAVWRKSLALLAIWCVDYSVCSSSSLIHSLALSFRTILTPFLYPLIVVGLCLAPSMRLLEFGIAILLHYSVSWMVMDHLILPELQSIGLHNNFLERTGIRFLHHQARWSTSISIRTFDENLPSTSQWQDTLRRGTCRSRQFNVLFDQLWYKLATHCHFFWIVNNIQHANVILTSLFHPYYNTSQTSNMWKALDYLLDLNMVYKAIEDNGLMVGQFGRTFAILELQTLQDQVVNRSKIPRMDIIENPRETFGNDRWTKVVLFNIGQYNCYSNYSLFRSRSSSFWSAGASGLPPNWHR